MAIIDNQLFSQTNPSGSSLRTDHAEQHAGLNDEVSSIEDTLVQGYVRESATVAYVSPSSFTVSGNVTAIYTAGRIVRFSNNSTAVVTSSSYSNPNTTVNITDGTVPSSLSYVDISLQPKGGTKKAIAVGTSILDTNGNKIIETSATPSAVNQVKIKNAATDNNPSIEASGDDTYIPLLLKGKSASPRVGGVYDNGNLSGNVTIDCKKGTRQKGTLTGNVTITISNPSEGEALELFLLQDATGGRTISFSTTIIWQDNTTPTWTTTASKMNSIALRYVGSTWYGMGAKFA